MAGAARKMIAGRPLGFLNPADGRQPRFFLAAGPLPHGGTTPARAGAAQGSSLPLSGCGTLLGVGTGALPSPGTGMFGAKGLW